MRKVGAADQNYYRFTVMLALDGADDLGSLGSLKVFILRI